MNTAKLSQFTNSIGDYYAVRKMIVRPWQDASRKTKNILEIFGPTSKRLVYIKDRSDFPGFWGLNENQVSALNKANMPWSLILLVGNSEEGYILTNEQVKRGILDDRWSRDNKEYKLHEGQELYDSTSFKTFVQAFSILDPNLGDPHQVTNPKISRERSFARPVHEPHNDLSEEADRLIENKENQYTESKLFDPKDIQDGRERAIASIVRRRGQPKFRKKLLQLYQGRCAITGANAEHVLEAAHILPYKGEFTNHPANGLLLRADLHILFDLRLIAINTMKMRVVISHILLDTNYREINGLPLQLPQREDDWPSKEALDIHRQEAKL